MRLFIDLETYSSEDLKRGGVYRYAQGLDLLLLAFAFDDEPVQVVDVIGGEPIPKCVTQALTDPSVVKSAWNAQFERVILGSWFETRFDPAQWDCTMVRAMMAGLPASLAEAGFVLGTSEQKYSTGRALINYFCKPCKPTKKNNMRTRNLPGHDPEKWDLFKTYNGQDVSAERAVYKVLTC